MVRIYVYILCCKYQVKIRSAPWFSAASAAAIVHRDCFFGLYQQNSSSSKTKFRQASNHCKSVLEAAKLLYANKTKESTLSLRNLVFETFCKLLIVLTKVNMLSVCDKEKLLAGIFSENSYDD